MTEQEILFKNLKSIKDYWVKTSVDSLGENVDMIWSDCEKDYSFIKSLLSSNEAKQSYSSIIDEVAVGIIHSILVMFDGGSELSDHFNIDIINTDKNKSLTNDVELHDEFIGYLLDHE